MRLGILTAGGDRPGLNAVIRAVVTRAIRMYAGHVRGSKTAGSDCSRTGFPGLDFKPIAVNDITDAATLAHLLRYDSVHGGWTPAAGTTADGHLRVGDRKLQVMSEKDPAKLPWRSLGVDVVLEATGRFTDRDACAAHLAA